MVWANDLGFDGIAAQGRYEVAQGVTPFLTAGAFPVFNTDFNFATNQPAKFKSEDKYLFAAQIGTDWTINKDFARQARPAPYYYFDNIEGKLSDPFTPLTTSDQGNTDDSRPAFAQNGNTYIPIRDIVPDAREQQFGAIDQFQYYGLATKFRELAVDARLDFNAFEPFQVSLKAEYVKNLAFERAGDRRRGRQQPGRVDDLHSGSIRRRPNRVDHAADLRRRPDQAALGLEFLHQLPKGGIGFRR